MNEIIINLDNIGDKDVTETVKRVKALIFYEDKILLGYSHNIYQFPGGHIENKENSEEALSREIKEETGIQYDTTNCKPFLTLKNYNKDHPSLGKNRLSIIYYYDLKINSLTSTSNTEYTQHEIEGNYKLKLVKFKNVIDVLKSNSNKYPESKWIANEMIKVINEYNKQQEIA